MQRLLACSLPCIVPGITIVALNNRRAQLNKLTDMSVNETGVV